MPPTVFPTGVTINLPQEAHPTFVLFTPGSDRSVLIDMNGNEAHGWDFGGHPPEMIDPAIPGGGKGRIFAQRESDIFANENLLELDWDGNVVWEWGRRAPRGKARLTNGNTLVLSGIQQPVRGLTEDPIADDILYEVTPEGEIAWSWTAGEHLDEWGYGGEKKPLLLDPHLRPGNGGRGSLLAFNGADPLGDNKWYRDGDERFHPDNILLSAHRPNFIAIIERGSGKTVWLLGPDYPGDRDMRQKAFTGDPPRAVDSISNQHDPHMIPPDLPGGGNILLFDNQGQAGIPPIFPNNFMGSRVLEIDPHSKEIVWQYDGSASGRPLWSFLSSFLSSARRLPNGNTIICEGMYGRIFQVTNDGRIVWEYINPAFRAQDPKTGPAPGTRNNQIYRAQPIPYEWVPDGTPHEEEPVIPEGFRE